MTPRCEWYFRLSDSNISAKSKLNAKYCSMFIRVQMGSNHELIYVYKISWHTPFNVTVFKSFNFQIWLMKSPKWMSLDWSLIIRILLFSFFSVYFVTLWCFLPSCDGLFNNLHYKQKKTIIYFIRVTFPSSLLSVSYLGTFSTV